MSKCLAFFAKCFVGLFSFYCHQYFNNEQYHNMKKKQAKEHTPVFVHFQSIKAFEHFNIRFKHSKIWTFQYSNICRNAHNENIHACSSAILIYSQKKIYQYFQSRNAIWKLISKVIMRDDKMDSQKWRNSQSSTRTSGRVWQIRSRSWKMWWCSGTSF